MARRQCGIFLVCLLSTACRGEPPPTPIAGHSLRVSDDELVAFVHWQRDYAALLSLHLRELDAVGGADPGGALHDPKAFEAKVAVVAARQAPIMKALRDRVPLQGIKAELAAEALGGIFRYDSPFAGSTLVIARDDVRLDAARRRFGKDAIDDIVSREALILAALGERRDDSKAGGVGVPTPAELEAYVSGAGAVRLGMTEAEVTTALGRNPSRRDDASSRGVSKDKDLGWNELNGPRLGAALGRFLDNRLYSIEFTPAEQAYPRIDYTTADAVTRADYVLRAVAKTLRVADIEAAVRVRGYRAAWAIMGGFGSPTRVQSKWIWEVDPGDRILYVQELDGIAGQPIIRGKSWGKGAINSGS